VRKQIRYVLGIIGLLLVTTVAEAQSVYKTPSGAKYHTAHCRTVKNVSTKITITEAVALGLQPCKVCRPAVMAGAYKRSSKNTSGEDKTVQCRGYTKKGTRCQHMTRIANGYCFQHNPG